MKKSVKLYKSKKYTIAAVALIIAGVAILYFYSIKDDSVQINNTTSENGIQYEGPTQAEIDSVNRNKDRLAEENKGDDYDQLNEKQLVQPVVTSARMTEVRSFIPSIVEESGACSVKFSNGDIEFTKTVKAFPNVNNTNCESIILTDSDFAIEGKWSVQVSYDSSTSAGESETVEIEVTK